MSAEMKSLEQLSHLIKDIRFAMFTTRHANGNMHSRPMTTQNTTMDDGCLWFFMSAKGEPVADIGVDASVGLSYADPGKDTYVSVSGTAKITKDMAKAKALWTPMAKAWFVGGIDDPDLALVQVKIAHAHYWDIKENKLTQLYVMAKAAMTGEKPAPLGESGEVRVQR